MDDSNPQPNPGREGSEVNGSMTLRDWERLPANPDPNEDLGYELSGLETYDSDDEILVIPHDEDMLREDAFIVISEEDMVTLAE